MRERIKALELRMTDGWVSRDKALDVALQSLKEHLATLNEFRGAMADQATSYVTKREHEIAVARLETVEKQMVSVQTRYAVTTFIVSIMFSTIVVAANILVVWFHR